MFNKFNLKQAPTGEAFRADAALVVGGTLDVVALNILQRVDVESTL